MSEEKKIDEDTHWYDRCKNNNTECESDRGPARLCDDCQRDAVDEAKEYTEEQEYDAAIDRQEAMREGYD